MQQTHASRAFINLLRYQFEPCGRKKSMIIKITRSFSTTASSTLIKGILHILFNHLNNNNNSNSNSNNNNQQQAFPVFGFSPGKSYFLLFADVTVLLSLTVFMNLVSEIMPTTSDAVPLIGRPVATKKQTKKATIKFLL